jgi:hypothetical protein
MLSGYTESRVSSSMIFLIRRLPRYIRQSHVCQQLSDEYMGSMFIG